MNKMLYTMVRVGDLDRSVDFYTRVLGMRVRETVDNPTEKYTLVFVGVAGDPACIELTHNHGVSEYERGSGYGHIAFEVDDCVAECRRIEAAGGNIALAPRHLESMNEMIAFITDPDGYRIELVQRLPTAV